MIGIISCKEVEKGKSKTLAATAKVGTYNFDNKEEVSEYNRLDLDKTHPNLLNPNLSKDDYQEIIESWKSLHQEIGSYLAKNDFDWGVEDTSVTIVHKIYFTPEGEIKNYFFNILNEEVPMEKKEKFGELVSNFSANNRISIQRDQSFAQCGKTRYLNK